LRQQEDEHKQLAFLIAVIAFYQSTEQSASPYGLLVSGDARGIAGNGGAQDDTSFAT
jgi:hypothetical protein